MNNPLENPLSNPFKIQANHNRPPSNLTEHRLPMRRVQRQTHQTPTDQTGNRHGHDPGEEKEADTLPVDSLEGTVAQTDTDGGAGDAHGGRHGQGVLREDEDGDGGAQFHGRTTAGGVVGELVTHDCNGLLASVSF